jgi:hypothetical protein
MGVWAGAANGGARPVQYRSGIWRWMRSIPEIKSFSFWMCNDHSLESGAPTQAKQVNQLRLKMQAKPPNLIRQDF